MRRLGLALGRLIRAALIVWGATLVAVCLWTFLWPMDRPLPHGDVILCLSSGVNADGTADSGSRVRAEACGAAYRRGAAPLVILSGGGFPVTAASAMAVVADVPQDAVQIEDRAASTLQNIIFAQDMLPADARVILVTEAYHLPRAWASARLLGMRDVTLHAAARLENQPRPGSLVRESAAIWFNVARYSIWRVASWLGVPDARRINWLI